MEAPAGTSVATTRAARRVNQDYVKMYQFLTSDVWQILGSQESQRAKAEALSEFAYLTLELRLPTEQTLGMMTALVVCTNRKIQAFDLQTALQLTRSSWKSVFKRLERSHARMELLAALPGSFAELPAHIQGRLTNVAAQQEWLLTEGELDLLMRRIKLRASPNLQDDTGRAAQALANSLLSLLPGCGPFGAMGNAAPPQEVPLKNLRIFSPKRGGTQERRALPATSATASSHMGPRAGSENASVGMLALRDVPAREVAGSEQPVRLQHGPAGSGVAGPAGSGGGGPVGSGLAGPEGSVPCPGESVAPLADIDRRGTVVEPPRAAQRGEHGQGLPDSPARELRTPNQETKAAVDTSPYPFASDFLRERGVEAEVSTKKPAVKGSTKKAAMKRPAARGETTTVGRGLKRPAASKPKTTSCEAEEKLKKAPAKKKVSKIKDKATVKRKDDKNRFCNYSFQAKGYGFCRVEYYTAKSYIRKWDDKQGRYTMIIGSCGDKHQQVCSALIKHVQAGLQREKLLALRAALMAR
eukprot:s2802_g10.t1